MGVTILTLLLGIVVILAIIAANGYFVAQEFAYMSVDRNRLSARAEAGDKAASRALKVTRRTSFMLSGAQLGITVTGLLVGYVAEPLVGESLGELLGGAGVPAAVSVTVGTTLALVVATVVQMIFGELYPKNLAIANPEPLARGLARSTTAYLTVFGWLIVVFDRAANLILRMVGVKPVEDLDSTATAEDLERIVADARESGNLPENLSVLLDRILDFPERTVEHAMVPRPQTGVVTPGASIGEVRQLMATGHTRYPVVTEDQEPVGVVELADLLRGGIDENAAVSELMRPAVVVPSLMSLPDALRTLTRSRAQLAAVVDEYGGFAGVVTIEDLAEELVGELTDEHDVEPESVIAVEEDGCWRMDGDVHVDEAERALGRELPHGDYETVAGLAIATHGELPEVGRIVTVELPIDPRDLISANPEQFALEIEVLELDRLVPSELRMRLVEVRGSGSDEGHPGVPDEKGDAL
ncbi:hemolysin family protein [Dietzia maris]|uniref:hemolysin family protein n=1 Tax=Dietzia maris TaxID=37915 RepID=UPI00223AB5B4|nr:hemolysin family protein [Dietzia maris]MCT1432284.1 hemolysin family protein [Dietzia maris]MCT1519546.1 hemolysin family protein [Dietzia maris]